MGALLAEIQAAAAAARAAEAAARAERAAAFGRETAELAAGARADINTALADPTIPLEAIRAALRTRGAKPSLAGLEALRNDLTP